MSLPGAGARGLRVGLAGAGFLARTRARCWRRVHGVEVHLAGVAARRPERARAFAHQLGVERVLETAEELVEDPGIDLVDLCVPNRLHRPLAERAAAAGKAILCTKPLAAYVGQDLEPGADAAATPAARMLEVAEADARAMVEAARQGGVPLFYGENWVTAPSVVKALELGARAPGRILDMRGWECHSGSHSAYSAEWGHAGGGALLRLGAHPLGAMLWLKRLEGLRRDGRPVRPVAVTGEVASPAEATGGPGRGNRPPGRRPGQAFPGRGPERWGTLVVAFEDGSRGVAIGSDTLLGGMQSRLVVLAADHHLECNLSPQHALRAYAPGEHVFGDAYIMEKVDARAGWSTPMPDEDWTSGQQGLCQSVAEAASSAARSIGRARVGIRDADDPGSDDPGADGPRELPRVPDGELGLDVVRCIYAGYLSAEEGRRVSLEPALEVP